MRCVTKRLIIFVFLTGMLWSQPDAFALRVDKTFYPYPYTNPYLATTTLSIMKGRDELTTHDRVSRQTLEIKVLENRDDIPLLEGMGKLRVRFYQQSGFAPLIFIVPGIGGSANSGIASYIAELFADRGFHVLILPSPFNWNFMLATSRSGVPGLAREDSEDLYSAMQQTLSYVKTGHGARVGRTGLIGLSSGATNAAYISQLDAEQRKIGIETYLLVNPPVSVLKAIEKIDRMAQLENEFGAELSKRIRAYGLGIAAKAYETKAGDPVSDPSYFSNWEKEFRLPETQTQYLIGNTMQSPIGDVIYVSELMHHPGVLKTPVTYASRTERFHEAYSHSLMDYLNMFLIPRLNQAKSTKPSADTLNVHLSLKGVESTLATNKNIFVMHNRDDFLVSSEDLGYLERLMGNRTKIYPYGGHLGNLWFPQNRTDLVNIFTPLLGSGGREMFRGAVSGN